MTCLCTRLRFSIDIFYSEKKKMFCMKYPQPINKVIFKCHVNEAKHKRRWIYFCMIFIRFLHCVLCRVYSRKQNNHSNNNNNSSSPSMLAQQFKMIMISSTRLFNNSLRAQQFSFFFVIFLLPYTFLLTCSGPILVASQ